MLSLTAAAAVAQQPIYMDTGNPNVTVDLSVIDDGGWGAPNMAVPPAFGGLRLRMPGQRAPLSQFYLPGGPAAALARSKPSRARAASASAMAKPPKMAAARTKAKKRQAPAPAKAPRTKVETSKAPPPPATTTTAPAPPPTPPKAMQKSAAAPAAPASKAKVMAPVSVASAGSAVKPGQTLKVLFPETASKMPAAAKDILKGLVAGLKGKDKLRLQLHAYAGGKSLSSSKARRLSLSRALSVRSYLIETGVRSTRIDVRALGNKASDGPLNRVDVVVVER